MTKITITPDCGNSPRKGFLKDFNIAFATGDVDFIIEHVSDDIHWEIYGDQSIQGMEQFFKKINAMKSNVADEVVIHTIITHGKEASLNGKMKIGDKTYAFCDVYRFVSAGSSIVKELYSYVIRTNS
jgi:hypothetical protein